MPKMKTKPPILSFAVPLRLSLVAASVLCVAPLCVVRVQAQTFEQPEAPSIPLPIPDDIIIEPARRQVEQPASKPINSIEEAARQADEKREAADRATWQQAFAAAGGDAAESSSPAKTLQLYQAFLKSHRDLHPAVAVEAGIRIAHLQEGNLKQPDAALVTLQELWQSNKKHPSALSALGEQAKLMARQGKGAEAEAVARPQLEKALAALESRTSGASGGGRKLLQGLVASLRAQGKGAKEAVPVLLRVLREQPAYLDAGSQADGGWMYREAVESLLEDKQAGEALKWAKLCFVESPFEVGPLGSASALVAKALGASDTSGASLEQWAKAQKDAAAPNPLRAVKLPLLNVDGARAKLRELGKGHDTAPARIGLLLWLGDGRGAMEEARHMLDGLTPQEAKARASEPVLEACRVFKARDLNLKGGNSYLKWLRDKQGIDPVEVFLGKTAPAATGEEG